MFNLENFGQNALPEKQQAELDSGTKRLINEQYNDALTSEQDLANRNLEGVNLAARPVPVSNATNDAIARKYNQIAGVELNRIKQAAQMEAIGQRSNNLQRAAQLLISKQRADLGAMQAAQTARFEAQAARRRAMGQLLNVGSSIAGYGAGGGFAQPQQQQTTQQQQPAQVQTPQAVSAGYTMPQVGQSAVRGTMSNASQYQYTGSYGDYGQGGEY